MFTIRLSELLFVKMLVTKVNLSNGGALLPITGSIFTEREGEPHALLSSDTNTSFSPTYGFLGRIMQPLTTIFSAVIEDINYQPQSRVAQLSATSLVIVAPFRTERVSDESSEFDAFVHLWFEVMSLSSLHVQTIKSTATNRGMLLASSIPDELSPSPGQGGGKQGVTCYLNPSQGHVARALYSHIFRRKDMIGQVQTIQDEAYLKFINSSMWIINKVPVNALEEDEMGCSIQIGFSDDIPPCHILIPHDIYAALNLDEISMVYLSNSSFKIDRKKVEEISSSQRPRSAPNRTHLHTRLTSNLTTMNISFIASLLSDVFMLFQPEIVMDRLSKNLEPPAGLLVVGQR